MGGNFFRSCHIPAILCCEPYHSTKSNQEITDVSSNDGRRWGFGLRSTKGRRASFHRSGKGLGHIPAPPSTGVFIPRWAAIVTGERDLQPELAEVLSKIAPSVDANALIEYWFENDSRISIDVLDAISTMRGNGAKIFLATNQEHRRANYLMNEMGLSAAVDGIFYSAALGCRKPSSEFYQKATRIAGAPVSEIFFVDDTLDNIEAARAFGWNTLHWTVDSTAHDLLHWWSSTSPMGRKPT